MDQGKAIVTERQLSWRERPPLYLHVSPHLESSHGRGMSYKEETPQWRDKTPQLVWDHLKIPPHGWGEKSLGFPGEATTHKTRKRAWKDKDEEVCVCFCSSPYCLAFPYVSGLSKVLAILYLVIAAGQPTSPLQATTRTSLSVRYKWNQVWGKNLCVKSMTFS